MFGTFLYLTVCGGRNRLRVRLRRLREPRYLIGFVVGAAYMYFAFFARAFHSSSARRPGGVPTPLAALARFGAMVPFVASVMLFGFAVIAWLWPGSRRPIEFTRSEVQFLFPAPLTRRQLLHYKLLRSQLALVFGSAIATLVLRPATLASSWTVLVGLWIVLIAIRLYSMGVSLTRASLGQAGAGRLVRRWLPIAIVIGAVAALGVTAGRDWARLSALSGPGDVADDLRRMWSVGIAGAILWPFAVLARLPLAASPSEFLGALPGAIAILALSYAWVLQADASFEEASADRAEKVAASKIAPRTAAARVMPTPFSLAATGRAELAIMWKNLISVGRFVSVRTLIRLLVIVFAVVSASRSGSRNGGLASLLATLCAVLIGMIVLIGAQMVRNDLRQDLARLTILKTWPIRGATLMRGELAAPAAILTAVVWLLIVAELTLIPYFSGQPGSIFGVVLDRLSYGAAAIMLAPALILVQLVVTNGIAVMFPAWIAIGSSRARGIDAMGQRLLMMAGLLVSLVLALLPAALVAGIVGFSIYWTTQIIPVVLPAAVAAAVVIAECWVAIELLGRVLDRTDVNSVEATE